MKVFHDAAAAGRELSRPWVTVGNFDGLHAGHRAVIGRVLERARGDGAASLAVTFRPHPAAVLSDAGPPGRLSSDAQQRELLEDAGLTGLLLQPFDEDLARLPAEDFYRGVLRGALGARGIVVGSNFRFGAHRAGDVDLLRRLARTEGPGGPDVEDVPRLLVDGQPVSSSRIRALVAEGRIEEAEPLLGRPFTVEGRVVQGEGRGRKLGFPTANVEPRESMLPGPGVYACVLRRDEQLLGAVANVGRRPTFGPRALGIEAHALDFDGSLYGERVRLSFLARLRDEQRFASADDLVAQVRQDVARARALLERRPPESLRGVAGT